MSHLVLTIRFLDARYHGRAEGDAREWPPSPMRLFAALLAGAKASWSDARREAFLWLEQQLPPEIHATKVRHGTELLTYVPNNNSDAGDNLRTAKFVRPTLLEDPPIVQYLWTIEEGDVGHAEVVASVAQHLRALGWGIDLAIGHGRVVQSSASADNLTRFKPLDSGIGGGPTLRVPIAGSLASLENAYTLSLHRIRDGVVYDQPGPPVCDKQVYGTEDTRPFCVFALRTPDEDVVAVRPQRIKELVGMIRGLAAELVRSTDHAIDVDRVILGHPPDAKGPRLSILPLPSIGHRHSDGLIRRVILTESAGESGSLSSLLYRLLNDADLQQEETKEALTNGVVRLARLSFKDRFLRFYTGPSSVWDSVTPLLLPGYDDRRCHRGDHQHRLARAEALVCKALAQSGIDVPARIELFRVPRWPGTLHAREYRPRQKLSHYPRWHVRLTFERPFSGPLALGAGRHVGFGLFAALMP